MFEPRIRISRELHKRLKQTAQEQGYSSTREFALHVLEKACSGEEKALSDSEIEERLKGMGYLE